MASKLMLGPGRFLVSDYARTIFVATAEQGTKQEDLMSPDFWANVAPQCKPWDRIEVRSDDGTFYGEYLILSVGRAWVKVFELNYIKLTSSDVSVTQADKQDGFEIKWRGPKLQWSVIREKDREPIKDHMGSEEEAATWLKDYLKATA